MEKRDYRLDILKIIATIFVCCYHFAIVENLNYTGDFNFNRLIFGIISSCIPIFMMVNGALLLNKNYISFKKHYIKVLNMIALFIFYRFLTIVLISLYNNNNPFLNIRQLINAVFLFHNYEGIDFNHFWFIPILIEIYLLFPFFKKIFETEEKVIILTLIILFVSVLLKNDFNNIKVLFDLDNKIDLSKLDIFIPFTGLMGVMSFYFLIGGLIYKYKGNIKVNIFIPLLSFLVGIILLYIEWNILCSKKQIQWDSVFNGYTTIATCLMSLSIFIIVLKIPNEIFYRFNIIKKVIYTLGNNTLNVYYLHWIFGYTLFFPIFKNIKNAQGGSIFINLLKAVLFVVFFSFGAEVLKKIPIIKKLLD